LSIFLVNHSFGPAPSQNRMDWSSGHNPISIVHLVQLRSI